MVKIIIEENQSGQRLDRFLKKYYSKAPLSLIYRMIRKDVKLNGKRAHEDVVLNEGDELTLYITDEESASLKGSVRRVKARKQFTIPYEDENVLIADKPFGLLTHGDSHEKKNHLANQVMDYLISKGEYDPVRDRTFTPAPCNRIDRNTTGLVIFAKNPHSLREINAVLRTKEGIEKYYLTILCGDLNEELFLKDSMVKDQKKNRAVISGSDAEGAKTMETLVTPLDHGTHKGRPYTLAQVRIFTGRTHQIRSQLANAGYPLLGDTKYGESAALNPTQLLHSWKLYFREMPEGKLSYLSGRTVECDPPENFKAIEKKIFRKE